MKVYDTTNTYDSLVHDVWDLTSTDSTSLPLSTIIRDFNQKYYDIGMMAWKYSNTWKFDDKNYSSLPQATTDLVDLQMDYELETNYISIEKVEVLDANGNWNKLKKWNISDQKQATSEYYKDSNAGIPTRYDLSGNSIYLYPKPKASDVTLTSGLKIYLGRLVMPFDTSTTTTKPGFNLAYHRILSFYSAMMWFMKSGDGVSAKNMQVLMVDLEDKLKNYFSKRQSEDNKVGLKPKIEKYN